MAAMILWGVPKPRNSRKIVITLFPRGYDQPPLSTFTVLGPKRFSFSVAIEGSKIVQKRAHQQEVG